jgi:hypothetical protein
VRWVREEFNVARFNFRNALDSLGAGIRAQLPPIRRAHASERLGDRDGGPTAYSVTRRDGSSVGVELLMPLSTGRQRYSRGTLVVSERGSIAGRPSRAVPADAYIQVDDSAVVAVSDGMGDLVTPTGFGRLAQALARQVVLDTTPDAAKDAAGAARTGRASPEGLARLMAAVLLRHGFSARLAIGVRPVADTLLTAVWVEAVHRNLGEWLAVDPISGRLMSTAWIRVSHAGTAEPAELLPLVADVRFTLVDPQATEGATP